VKIIKHYKNSERAQNIMNNTGEDERVSCRETLWKSQNNA
jgi:hypothetical protein